MLINARPSWKSDNFVKHSIKHNSNVSLPRCLYYFFVPFLFIRFILRGNGEGINVTLAAIPLIYAFWLPINVSINFTNNISAIKRRLLI